MAGPRRLGAGRYELALQSRRKRRAVCPQRSLERLLRVAAIAAALYQERGQAVGCGLSRGRRLERPQHIISRLSDHAARLLDQGKTCRAGIGVWKPRHLPYRKLPELSAYKQARALVLF